VHSNTRGQFKFEGGVIIFIFVVDFQHVPFLFYCKLGFCGTRNF
jgi:hypothetical protein